MRWEAKSNPTQEPKLGDEKEKVWFALFPRRVEGQWLWFEKYIAVYKYETYLYEYDEIVSQGIFTEKYRTHIATGKKWTVINRKLIK